MKDYSNIFLMSDMDGTLINSHSQISTINKYAIERFTKLGGTFAVATGRTFNSCKDMIKDLPINAPSIFYNGTIMQDVKNNLVIKTMSLEGHELFSFLEICMTYCPEICVELHTKDTFYTITSEKYDDPVIAREKPIFVRTSLSAVKKMDLDILKVQFYTEDQSKISWLHNFAQAMEIDKIAKYFVSWSCYFEIIPKHASKGVMLEELRKMPMYKDKIFIAVGDFDNDIEMLRFADYGIAAQNATDNVKKVVDIIGVSCDEHLLSHVITDIIPALEQQLMVNMVSTLQTA